MTAVNLARRALFRQTGEVVQPLRPPWSLLEAEFTEACTRCGDCLNACPTKVIKLGSGGFPEVDFAMAECTFCGDCEAICETGALNQTPTQTSAWSYQAEIKQSCLSLQGVFCRSCGDVCDQRAISFSLQLGGKAQPEIDSQTCNGCGACVAPCPTSAIVIKDAAHE